MNQAEATQATDLRLIDSHCHLHDTEFFADNREELYQQSIAAGIGMICVGTDERSSRQTVEFAANHDRAWAEYVILNPADAKGRWQEIFGNDHPIHVEVGSGKGAFVSGMAKANPDINYIGIDIQKSVLSYALDKVLTTDVPNIKLLWVDGSDLTDYFEEGEIDRLYQIGRAHV